MATEKTTTLADNDIGKVTAIPQGVQWEFQQMDCSAAILCDNSVLRVGKEAAA